MSDNIPNTNTSASAGTQSEAVDMVLDSVAICGVQSPLGQALFETLTCAGTNIVVIKDSDLRLSPPALARKLNNVKVVINLYGEPYVAKWTGRYEFDIYKSRLEAIRAIGTAIRYADPKPECFMVMSNAMVYDPYEVHDEYSTVYGDSFMSEVAQMETDETMKIAGKEPQLRLVLVRMDYIMSNLGGAYPLLSSLARMGWGGSVTDGYQCLPMIHEIDAVRAMIGIASDGKSSGIYNMTIPEMASMNELVEAFANTMDKKQHRLPKFIVRLATGRAYNLLEQNCKVIPQRLINEGFEFLFPTVGSIIKDLQKRK